MLETDIKMKKDVLPGETGKPEEDITQETVPEAEGKGMDPERAKPEDKEPESAPEEKREPEEQEDDEICVHDIVLTRIAEQAALKVPGVREMSGNFADDMAKIIGREKSVKGVRVRREGISIKLILSLVAYFDTNISDMANQVQELVKKDIWEYASTKIDDVDVVIDDIVLKEETKEGDLESREVENA